MNRWTFRPLLAVCVVALAATVASARVDLRFAPPDTTVEVGADCRMSILLDAPLEIRTIDVNVTYDTTVVRSLGGGAGTLYTDSGIFTFQGFEEDTLGHWHGYAILMGAGLFIQGPGELFYWLFEGLAEGTTPIIAVEAYLSTTDGSWFEDVVLPQARVTVGDPLSSVIDVPLLRKGLDLWPNPFNPRTFLSFDLQDPGYARLSVYDLRGRELVVLHDGATPSGGSTFVWDGTDRGGRPQPGGQYVFRLVTGDDVRTAKATLVK